MTGGKGFGEWEYLINTRTVNGDQGEGHSYQLATINSDVEGGKYGLIIYPDKYTAQMDKDAFTSIEWTDMEAVGVEFLPTAGCRQGNDVTEISTAGNYWSATDIESTNEVFGWYFGEFSGLLVAPRHQGLSVRLISDF